MKITKEQIKAFDPCADGYEWYLEHGTEDLLETLLKVDGVNPGWARWLFLHLMNMQQRRQIAIFAAEQGLPLFEKKYPNDDRPRKAIEVAKAVLAGDTGANRIAADAAYAAYAVANVANAAYAAYAAVNAATYAAIYASYAAAEREEVRERIIREAVRILDGGGR